MPYSFRKDDPLYYKKALMKLFLQAKENGVNIDITKNCVTFDDTKDGITTTICTVRINDN